MTSTTDLAPSWVYSMADYCQMFDLQGDDLDLALLDYPAGISSFNAEMHEKGYSVCSGDAHYQMALPDMQDFSKRVLEGSVVHLKMHQGMLRGDQDTASIVSDWENRQSLFLKDYELGKKEQRYQFMALPRFPFDDYVFDLALCSDHLFHLDVMRDVNHEKIIKELCRVAKEVRVFPLLDENGNIAERLGELMLLFQEQNYGIEVREVPYQQMKGGNAMLRIWATECVVEE